MTWKRFLKPSLPWRFNLTRFGQAWLGTGLESHEQARSFRLLRLHLRQVLGCDLWVQGVDQLALLCMSFPTSCTLQGTSLVLGPLNYLFVHTFNSGKYCLGVFDNGRAGGREDRGSKPAKECAYVLSQFRTAASAFCTSGLVTLGCAHACAQSFSLIVKICPLALQAPCWAASPSAMCWCSTTAPTSVLALAQVRSTDMLLVPMLLLRLSRAGLSATCKPTLYVQVCVSLL